MNNFNHILRNSNYEIILELPFAPNANIKSIKIDNVLYSIGHIEQDYDEFQINYYVIGETLLS